MSFHELTLDAGDHQGIDIDYKPGTGNTKLWSKSWLGEGHQGIRIIGEGPGKTHIRPGLHGGSLWETIKVGRHNGVVWLENLTVHCGYTAGIQMGWADLLRPIGPHFKLKLRNVHIVTDGTPINGRWGVFSYQCDHDFEDVAFHTPYADEHASYAHQFSRHGLRWNRVKVLASGAEGCKVRNDPTETVWIPTAKILLNECEFRDWYQPHSSRGGGGVVLQGTGVPLIWLSKCLFVAPPQDASHTRCLMVDDNGGRFWEAESGEHSSVYGEDSTALANGQIVVDRCAFQGGVGLGSLSPMIRLGNDGGSGIVAKNFTMTRSGLYGRNVQVQLGNLAPDTVNIENCNVPKCADWMKARGLDVSEECYVALGDRRKPISEGHLQ